MIAPKMDLFPPQLLSVTGRGNECFDLPSYLSIPEKLITLDDVYGHLQIGFEPTKDFGS